MVEPIQQGEPPPRRGRLLGAWTGVAVDVGLTLLLLVIGIDPVFMLVSTYRSEASLVLCVGHLMVVPAVMLTGAWRSNELDLLDAKTRVGKIMELAFIMFIVLGWMLPVAAAAVSRGIPRGLFMACIFVHVAPYVLVILLALVGLGKTMDRAIERLSGRDGARFLTILFSAYLAGVEVFLLLLRTGRASAAALTLPIWILSYVPTRLILARLTGLRGPERYTFVLSNLHLLARLLLADADG